MKLAHHFTGQFGNPMDAAQESGTWGDEGKAAGYRSLAALLSALSSLKPNSLSVIVRSTSESRMPQG